METVACEKKRIEPFLSELIRWGTGPETAWVLPSFWREEAEGRRPRTVCHRRFTLVPFRDRSNIPKQPRCSERRFRSLCFFFFTREATFTQRTFKLNKRFKVILTAFYCDGLWWWWSHRLQSCILYLQKFTDISKKGNKEMSAWKQGLQFPKAKKLEYL